MIKRLNIYWLILILIIAIQLIVPPNIGRIYYYLIILMIVFLVNGGFKLILRNENVKNQTDRFSFRSLKYMDFELFTSQMNNIAVATFLYFFYTHVIVLSNAIDNPSGSKMYEYVYRSKSYFMTYSEAEALHFWEFAIIVLGTSSIVMRIIMGLRRNNMP